MITKMKYVRISIIPIMFIVVLCGAKRPFKNIDGRYFNAFGEEIAIKGSTLTLNLHQGFDRMFATDTLAICTIKRINEDFIEINSELPTKQTLSSLSIEQFFDPKLKDSIRVEIRMPANKCIYANLEYSLCNSINKSSSISTYVKRGNGTMTIAEPRIASIGLLTLEPLMIDYSLTDLSFRGLAIEGLLLAKHIRDGVNVIIITIPTIDDSYFEKYYVHGEYIRIIKDCIVWRGVEYQKK